MSTVIIRPTSTYTGTSYQHWAYASSGGSLSSSWAAVDEATSDSDSTYVEASVTAYEFWGMSSPGISSGTISNVRLYFRTKSTNATSYSTPIIGETSSAFSAGTAKTNTTSYQLFYQDYTTNPRTGNAWQWSDFTNYYFGCEATMESKGRNRITQFYVEITYSETAAGYNKKVNGVTASKVNGISVANISKINGV